MAKCPHIGYGLGPLYSSLSVLSSYLRDGLPYFLTHTFSFLVIVHLVSNITLHSYPLYTFWEEYTLYVSMETPQVSIIIIRA